MVLFSLVLVKSGIVEDETNLLAVEVMFTGETVEVIESQNGEDHRRMVKNGDDRPRWRGDEKVIQIGVL